jgi:phosphotransferase system HPr-like phosphotransfer protein
MRHVLLFIAMLLCPALASAGGTIIVTQTQYVVVSGNCADTLGRTRLTPDSIRIVVTDSAGTELHDAWYEDADAQAVLNGDVLTFTDQWQDINGAATTGVFSLMVTIASDAQGNVDVYDNYAYTVISPDYSVEDVHDYAKATLDSIQAWDAANGVTNDIQAILDTVRNQDGWIAQQSTVTGGVALSAAAVDAIWNDDSAGHNTAGSYGQVLEDVLDSAWSHDGWVGQEAGRVKSVLDTIQLWDAVGGLSANAKAVLDSLQAWDATGGVTHDVQSILDTLNSQDGWAATATSISTIPFNVWTYRIDTMTVEGAGEDAAEALNGILDTLQLHDGWVAQQAEVANLNGGTLLAAADVWNIAFSTGFTAGSMGDSLNNASYMQGAASGLTATQVADTVWKSLMSARLGVAGSFADSAKGWGATSASSLTAHDIWTYRIDTMQVEATGEDAAEALNAVLDTVQSQDGWVGQEAGRVKSILDTIQVWDAAGGLTANAKAVLDSIQAWDAVGGLSANAKAILDSLQAWDATGGVTNDIQAILDTVRSQDGWIAQQASLATAGAWNTTQRDSALSASRDDLSDKKITPTDTTITGVNVAGEATPWDFWTFRIDTMAVEATGEDAAEALNGILDTVQSHDGWVAQQTEVANLNGGTLLSASDVWNVAFGTAFTAGSMGDSLNNASYMQGTASGLTAHDIWTYRIDTMAVEATGEDGAEALNAVLDTLQLHDGWVAQQSTLTGTLTANMTQVSGDATAADNFETMLDGTGGQAFTLGSMVINRAAAGSALTITAADGSGISVTGGTAGNGIIATGAGTGEGLIAVGGASGHGIEARGGTGAGLHGINAFAGTGSNGSGAKFTGDGTGAGLKGTGGSTGPGIRSEATGGNGMEVYTSAGSAGLYSLADVGDGVRFDANGAGPSYGMRVMGADDGAGMRIESGTAGRGLWVLGAGAYEGLRVSGGATGNGVALVGGVTSGDGLNVSAANGDAAELTSTTGGVDLNATLNFDDLTGTAASAAFETGYFDAFWNRPFNTAWTAGSMADSLNNSSYVQGAASGLTASQVADSVWKSLVSARSGVAGSFGDSALDWGRSGSAGSTPWDIWTFRIDTMQAEATGEDAAEAVNALLDTAQLQDGWIAQEAGRVKSVLDTIQAWDAAGGVTNDVQAILDSLNSQDGWVAIEAGRVKSVLDSLQAWDATDGVTHDVQSILDTLRAHDGWVAQQAEVSNLNAWNPATDSVNVDGSALAATTGAITATTMAAGSITVSEAPDLDAAISTRLAPTVAARTLDVAATGEAGVDLSNVNGTLSGAEIALTQAEFTPDYGTAVAGDAMALTGPERAAIADSVNVQLAAYLVDSLNQAIEASRLVALHQGIVPSTYDSAWVVMYPGAWTPNKDSLKVLTFKGAVVDTISMNTYLWGYWIVGSDSTAVADTVKEYKR